jgi:hypothetical protein
MLSLRTSFLNLFCPPPSCYKLEYGDAIFSFYLEGSAAVVFSFFYYFCGYLGAAKADEKMLSYSPLSF